MVVVVFFYFFLTRHMYLQILADAMGLGKTVMTIALILARLGRGNPDNEKLDSRKADDSRSTNKKKDAYTNTPRRAKGGTLIICPMALLSQWKVISYSLLH